MDPELDQTMPERSAETKTRAASVCSDTTLAEIEAWQRKQEEDAKKRKFRKKSVKVYELNDATGLEACEELEEGCMALLRGVQWEDVELQFGAYWVSGDSSSNRRMCFQSILDLFAIAGYKMVDVTVSDEGLEFLVERCSKKEMLVDESTVTDAIGDGSEDLEVERGMRNEAIPPSSSSEAGHTKSGRVLERLKTYENLCQKAPTPANSLPHGQVPGMRSTSGGLMGERVITRKGRDISRGSLRAEFAEASAGIPEHASFLSTAQDSATPMSSREYRRPQSGQQEDGRLICPHPDVDNETIPRRALSRSEGYFSNDDLKRLTTSNCNTRVRPNLKLKTDFSSTDSDSSTLHEGGPKKLSRMQAIFAARQLKEPELEDSDLNESEINETESYEDSLYSDNIEASSTWEKEFGTKAEDLLFSRNEEEYKLAASMYEMTGRRYPAHSRSSSNQSVKSNRSMITEVDPELYAWMTKEILTVKVRRDSHQTIPDSASLRSSNEHSQRSSRCFSDHFCSTPAGIQDSPSIQSSKHSFSDAALEIALRVPGPSRFPAEITENARFSTGRRTSSFSRSSYISSYSERSNTDGGNGECESTFSPPHMTTEKSEASPSSEEQVNCSRNGRNNEAGEVEYVSCAVKGLSLGSGVKVPCQLCMTDQPH